MFRNLTPHPIVLRLSDGAEIVIEPDPMGPARVSSTPGVELALVELSPPLGTGGTVLLQGAPTWGAVEGLPPEDEEGGIINIVSALVASRCTGRGDVFSPGTGPADGAIRSPDGRIQAVTRLIQAPRE
jgi:hypothetical protein